MGTEIDRVVRVEKRQILRDNYQTEWLRQIERKKEQEKQEKQQQIEDDLKWLQKLKTKEQSIMEQEKQAEATKKQRVDQMVGL